MTSGPFAHSGTPGLQSDWQSLDDHLRQTGQLAFQRGAALGIGHCAALAAAFHDFGKHDPDFQRRLTGATIRVDHSTAGAVLLMNRAKGAGKLAAELLAYAILGHHAGLPDRNGSDAAMAQRLDTFRDGVPAAVTQSADPDFARLLPELRDRMTPGPNAGFELSVLGRMVFSCLVDADYLDTEAYYDQLEHRSRDRDWPALGAILPDLRARFDRHMAGFAADSDLNRLRAEVLGHIRAGAEMPPGLFTLTVPTGGGKTLASLGFALDHAARHGHRRIIYAIPFTSIIDQTAATFRRLFGDIVLEHHSAIDIETRSPAGLEGRDKARLAMEDWAAPLVVTTNVQLFESLFAARPSRCRKLHNIAGSVIVLDEAQSLPRDLLMPTLRMIETLAAQYGCSVVLCTATQPAFDSRQLKRGGLPLAGRELAPDPAGLARRLRRARIVQGGVMADAALIAALRETPQGMVIVNSRKHALDLFRAAVAEGLEGMIHLTTRQYPSHRRRILDDVRARLTAGAPCRLIATSLIEAGVDVDFPKGWRAETGLDSIVQSAGRVNREGRRPLADSTLTVFRAPDQPVPRGLDPLIDATRSTAARHDDLLAPEAICHWFEQVYWTRGTERMGQPMVDAFVFGPDRGTGHTDFPYRTTAERYRMIDSPMVPVIIGLDAEASAEINRLGIAEVPSGLIARRLQPYTVQIPARARDLLVRNGHVQFAASHLRGAQFCVLQNRALYHADSGLRWEDAEYLASDQTQI